MDLPNYPRGFLLATRPVPVPDEFVAGPLLDGLWVHPDLLTDHAGDCGCFVIVLGLAFDLSDVPGASMAANLLDCLRAGEDVFFAHLDRCAGRYAVIFGDADHPRIVHDAAAMRAVFHARDGGVAGSHAAVVETAQGGEPQRSDLMFDFGYPGFRTPFSRTRVLPPNQCLDVHTGAIRRYWPRERIGSRTVDDVAAEILETASEVTRRAAQQRPLHMALTAGLDSRAILAVLEHAGVEFDTYTYSIDRKTRHDVEFAPWFAEQRALTHRVLDVCDSVPAVARRVVAANYWPHHARVASMLMRWLQDQPDSAVVTGHLLEIGGRGYQQQYRDGFAPPVSPGAMADIYLETMHPKTKRALTVEQRDAYRQQLLPIFAEFMEETRFLSGSVVGGMPSYNQFYWEFRMAAWHGPALVERDFYAEALIPFNVRSIFAAMQTVTFEEGRCGSVLFRLIERVDPTLLDVPINPHKKGTNKVERLVR